MTRTERGLRSMLRASFPRYLPLKLRRPGEL